MYIHDLRTYVYVRRSLKCLTSVDAWGQTALHAAAKSRASGFARFFSKLLLANLPPRPDPPVMELLGLAPLEVVVCTTHTHTHTQGSN